MNINEIRNKILGSALFSIYSAIIGLFGAVYIWNEYGVWWLIGSIIAYVMLGGFLDGVLLVLAYLYLVDYQNHSPALTIIFLSPAILRTIMLYHKVFMILKG